MNQIKLVIWDLDETFWKGTLSEGAVEMIPSNVELVKTLIQRGIMCSISSKNDLEPVKVELEKAGVWEYFIFPIINWNPKGENIRDIITRCQLRAPNVLFVDDNASNLKEAEFYNPGIMTMEAKDLATLLDDEGAKGKDDSKLSRLKQYKILEKKAEFQTTCSDNTDFLIKSNIRIEYIRDVKANSARIAELIVRSNQLNFTKIRIGEDEVLRLAEHPNYDCAAIHVVDNFGDYGICGFYALNKETKVLEHFLFSCRILNLGVENFIYQQLGCPKLDIVQPVSETIEPSRVVDWIKVITADEVEQPQEQKDSNRKKKRILLMGGCDLDQLVGYLPKDKIDILTDFNYVNKRGLSVHREHTVYLKNHDSYIHNSNLSEYLAIPFHDAKLFDYKFQNEEYDVLIYSVLMNYTQNIYRNKKTGMLLAYGGYDNILIKNQQEGFSESELKRFKEEWEYIGQQSPDEFVADLQWMLDNIEKPIIFLNGAEVDVDNPNEIGAKERHRVMNATLERFVYEYSDRCSIVDLRKYAKKREDVTDNIRHYKRIVYYYLAKKIEEKVLHRSTKSLLLTKIQYYVSLYIKKVNRLIKRMLKIQS